MPFEFGFLADRYKALGDATRLKIIALLKEREFCVCELVAVFHISQPAVSKHLSRLKSAGLITERRKGQWVYYALRREAFDELSFSLETLPSMTEEIALLEEKGLLVCCD
jgi:ArsR family transcriptional regulator